MAERFGVWGHAQAHLTAEMRAALATKLLQREADTRRSALSLDAKFAPDSPLEGNGFEPLVPLRMSSAAACLPKVAATLKATTGWVSRLGAKVPTC